MLELNREGLGDIELDKVIEIWKGKLRGFDAEAFAVARANSIDSFNTVGYAYAFSIAFASAHASTDAYDAAINKITQFWKEAVEEVKNGR